MEYNWSIEDITKCTMDHIKYQGLIYTFTNIYSLSLLSGMGIEIENSKEFLTHIQKNFISNFNCIQEPISFDFPYKLIPLQAVYTKGVPRVFLEEKESEEMNLCWNKNKMKKNISPQTQALLIYHEIQLAKYLYHHSLIDLEKDSSFKEKYIGFLFLNLAIVQGKFCYNHLRNFQGRFLDKKDKTKIDEKMFLKENKEKISLLNQFYMMEAYSHLYHILNDSNEYKEYYNPEYAQYFYHIAIQLLEESLYSENLLYQEKTGTLAEIISIAIKALELLDKKEEYEGFIIKLCAELSARKFYGEQLGNESFPNRSCSITTHSKALKALIKGYEQTHYHHFLSESHKIYHFLNQYWNNTLDLFDHKGNKKIKYSARDIGAILGGLIGLFSLDDDSNKNLLKNQIISFFHTSFNISGLQISPPSLDQRKKDMDPTSISFLLNKENSCVLLKEFKIHPKKYKISVNQCEYHTNQALYALREIWPLI